MFRCSSQSGSSNINSSSFIFMPLARAVTPPRIACGASSAAGGGFLCSGVRPRLVSAGSPCTHRSRGVAVRTSRHVPRDTDATRQARHPVARRNTDSRDSGSASRMMVVVAAPAWCSRPPRQPPDNPATLVYAVAASFVVPVSAVSHQTQPACRRPRPTDSRRVPSASLLQR